MGLKYTRGFLNKKSKAELLELEPERFDEDASTTMTVKEIRDELATIEEVEDELEDELEEDDEELPEEDEVDEAPPAKAPAKGKAKQTKYSNEAGTLGAKEVAAQIGTDAKTLRQFFRSGKSTFEAVGAGGRYEFKTDDVPKIKAEFEAWKSGKPGRGRAAGSGSGRKRGSSSKPVEVIEEVEEIEELEDLEELDEDDLDLEEEED